jgi:hypothetical protein
MASLMEIGAFATMNQRVIASDGFDDFLPTACYPERRVLRVLEGVPGTVDLEAIALDWALAAAEGEEEVLVAFKVDAASFKVIRRAQGQTQQGIYPAREAEEGAAYS